MNATGDITDAAMILVAHGATANDRSGEPAYRHASELRRRRLCSEVLECFVQHEPLVENVLERVTARRAVVVPLFTSEGWFSEHVIPERLGLRAPGVDSYERVAKVGSRIVHYARPVGSHPAMTEVLLARARDVVMKHPFPRQPRPSEMALFIAGHGTSYSRGSREAIERQVSRVRNRNEYGEVHAVFLEEEPHVRDVWDLTSAKAIVVVPFFISDGLHAGEDIPNLLGEPAEVVRERVAAGQSPWRNPTERHGRRLWYTDALGTEPVMLEVILERAREAAALQPVPGAPGDLSDGG